MESYSDFHTVEKKKKKEKEEHTGYSSQRQVKSISNSLSSQHRSFSLTKSYLNTPWGKMHTIERKATQGMKQLMWCHRFPSARIKYHICSPVISSVPYLDICYRYSRALNVHSDTHSFPDSTVSSHDIGSFNQLLIGGLPLPAKLGVLILFLERSRARHRLLLRDMWVVRRVVRRLGFDS